MCLGLMACSQSTNLITPLTNHEKIRILAHRSGDSWKQIHYQYPDTDRPPTRACCLEPNLARLPREALGGTVVMASLDCIATRTNEGGRPWTYLPHSPRS